MMRGANKLPSAKRAQILSLLCEGSSMHSTGCVVWSVVQHRGEAAARGRGACEACHDKEVRNVLSKHVLFYDIWSFCYAEATTVAGAKAAPASAGDLWTWTALDADTKLIIGYLSGGRDADYANHFMQDIASRLATPVQLTTDGHKPYLEAVEGTFGAAIDYAMLISEPAGALGRYIPGECIGTEQRRVE